MPFSITGFVGKVTTEGESNAEKDGGRHRCGWQKGTASR